MFKEELKAEIKDLIDSYEILQYAYVLQNAEAFDFDGEFPKEEQDKLKKINVPEKYHQYYVKALRLIRIVIPEREIDFINLNNNAQRMRSKDFDIDRIRELPANPAPRIALNTVCTITAVTSLPKRSVKLGTHG